MAKWWTERHQLIILQMPLWKKPALFYRWRNGVTLVRVGNICNIFLPLQTAPVLSAIRAVGVPLVLQLLYSTSLCSSSPLKHKAGTRGLLSELNHRSWFQKTQKIKISGENTRCHYIGRPCTTTRDPSKITNNILGIKWRGQGHHHGMQWLEFRVGLGSFSTGAVDTHAFLATSPLLHWAILLLFLKILPLCSAAGLARTLPPC